MDEPSATVTSTTTATPHPTLAAATATATATAHTQHTVSADMTRNALATAVAVDHIINGLRIPADNTYTADYGGSDSDSDSDGDDLNMKLQATPPRIPEVDPEAGMLLSSISSSNRNNKFNLNMAAADDDVHEEQKQAPQTEPPLSLQQQTQTQTQKQKKKKKKTRCLFFYAFALTQVMNRLDAIDKKYSTYIHKMELGIMDTLIAIPGTLFGVLGCPVLCLWYYYKYRSFLYPFCCFVVVCISHPMKYIIRRQRPLYENIGKKLIPLKRMHNDPSMPSGDTAQAAAAAVTLAFQGYSGWFCWLIPATSAFARVYFGSHFIGDCVVGAAFASVVTFIIHNYFQHYFP